MTNYVQSHIHLSDTLGASPENAPSMSWKVRDRKPQPIVYMSITTTLSGNVYAHVIGNDSPIKRTNYEFEVKLIGDDSHDMFYYEDLLIGLNGKECYFVDNYHVNDGEDHTVNIKRVIVSLGTIPLFTPGLGVEYVPMTLINLDN
jgi:hypothetical protein